MLSWVNRLLTSLGVVGIIAMIAMWVAMIIGYIMNIWTLLHTQLDPFTVKIGVRLIGIVLVPVGGFMGYID